MPVKAAGYACKKGAHDEGHDLVAGRVESHRFGGNLVIVGRQEPPAVGRANQADHSEHGQSGDGVHPKHGSVVRDPVQAQRPPERLDVLEDNPDDLSEAERDECQVVALKPEGRDTDGKARQSGAHAAHDERGQEQESLLEVGPARVPEELLAQKERDGCG